MIETLPPPTVSPLPTATLPRPGSFEASPAGAPPADRSHRTIQRSVRDDQICVLTFDRPGSAANIFDRRALVELGEELDFIARSPQLKGVILTSAKRSIFVAGADLNLMADGATREEVRTLIELGQAVMNRLAALPIPTAAAIHGAAVGGGCEVCLACDYRVASADRATRMRLPETQLGLLPAWGGSTRLPRLIGLPRALEIILAGKTLAAQAAWKCGLVDEIAPAEYVVPVAARLLRRGKPARRAHPLLNNRLTATVLGARLRSRLVKKTRNHYPAVRQALEVATRGVYRSVEQSLALERDGMLELVSTDACRNLVRLFFLQEHARKQIYSGDIRSAAGGGEVAPAATLSTPRLEPNPIARAAVIGSGVMGAGIAQWLSARRLPVILRDINAEQVAKGMANIARIYQAGVKRHAFTAIEARQGMDRIYPAPAEVPLGQVDLVIEAAAEVLEVKQAIFRRLDALAGEDTLLATNTSALPVSELAAATRRPDRVLGLHFFNPVHRMQLVEIVAARQTSPESLERALRFVQSIGKLPVIVKDSPGFLVNRILMPYLLEAGRLFETGAAVKELDEAMLDFGMPMGPMSLLDEVGIDVALHAGDTLAAHWPERFAVSRTLGGMVRAGLLGRKSGRGFYRHRSGKRPQLNPEAARFRRCRAAGVLRRQDLQDHMVLLMINEAARCIEEQIVPEPADVDFAMIMGTGFAPFRGGPLRYADARGAATLVREMERLVDAGSARFEPCDLLRNMSSAGTKFYPDK